eukprot:m.239419 g.239419  ORF g.239419 m.239419 type:complete len:450 (-) comp54373_c0_seq2:63-1412(-)
MSESRKTKRNAHFQEDEDAEAGGLARSTLAKKKSQEKAAEDAEEIVATSGGDDEDEDDAEEEAWEDASESGSDSEGVEYELSEEMQAMSASALFRQGLAVQQSGATENAQFILGEALRKFESEYDAERLNPVFHYEWASALRTVGSEVRNTECLEQASDHYRGALALITESEASAKSISDDLKKIRLNSFIGLALASIDKLSTIVWSFVEETGPEGQEAPAEQDAQDYKELYSNAAKLVKEHLEEYTNTDERSAKCVALAQSYRGLAESFLGVDSDLEGFPLSCSQAIDLALQYANQASTLAADGADAEAEIGAALAFKVDITPEGDHVSMLKEAKAHLEKAGQAPMALNELGQICLKLAQLGPESESLGWMAEAARKFQASLDVQPDQREIAQILGALVNDGTGDEDGDGDGDQDGDEDGDQDGEEDEDGEDEDEDGGQEDEEEEGAN